MAGKNTRDATPRAAPRGLRARPVRLPGLLGRRGKKNGRAGRGSSSTEAVAATGIRRVNQEHYTNTHFPEDTEKNDRKSRVPAAAAAFFRATRRWRSAFVSFWWHGVQSVRKLSRLQQPPPSATGMM